MFQKIPVFVFIMIIILLPDNIITATIFLFSIDRGINISLRMVVAAFLGILLALSFILFIVKELIFCFDKFLVVRCTKILEGMTAATIETISIRNISETGIIYFSVDSGPLPNRKKAVMLVICEL